MVLYLVGLGLVLQLGLLGLAAVPVGSEALLDQARFHLVRTRTAVARLNGTPWKYLKLTLLNDPGASLGPTHCPADPARLAGRQQCSNGAVAEGQRDVDSGGVDGGETEDTRG